MRIACLSLLTALGALGVGCRSFQLRPSFGARDVVASAASKDEVVALVNRNITGRPESGGLISWRCMQAKFQMPPMPGCAPGTIIVEAPRNFRLRVAHPIGGGDLLDVGSNPEEFWIWQKEMNPPYLLTSHHDDLPLALQQFKVPFQPDWIMEVLGVIPIDGSRYELHATPGKPWMELATTGIAPSGETLRKVVRVDTRRGWVLEHLLWGANGKLIASAELSDHRLDPATQIVTPRRIRIHWPEADMDLKITLDHLEVNPPHLPELVWQVPQKPGYKRVDMGAVARQRLGASAIQHVEFEAPSTPAGRAIAPASPPAGAGSPPISTLPAGAGLPPGAPLGSGAMPSRLQGSADPATAAAEAAGPPAFPGTYAGEIAGAPQPPPFPAGTSPPAGVPAPAGNMVPVREASAPLPPPGRVRLDALGSQ